MSSTRLHPVRRTPASHAPGRRALAAVPAALLLVGLAAPVAAQSVVELPRRDRALQPAPEEVYRVGALDGEAWETFGDVGSLGFDAEGRLYVFDRQSGRVVVVGRDGEFLREIGKSGEGPGELSRPMAMTVFRDGYVAVTDVGKRGALLFDPTGEWVHTVSLTSGGGTFSFGDLQADPRGGYGIMGGGGMRIRMSSGPGGAEEPEEAGRPIERIALDPAGTRHTVYGAWKPPADEAPDEGRPVSAGNVTFRMGAGPRVFEPGLHVAPLPDGSLAVVDSTGWRVKLVDPRGEVRRVLERPIEPREVTERIEERERERRLTELEEGEGPQMRIVVGGSGGGAAPIAADQVREMMKQQVASARFYPEIPVIHDLATGWDGALWIERTPEQWWEDGPIDVVGPDGTYRGTIPADGLRIPQAFGPDGLIARVERDELDVPVIVVERLPTVLR